MSGRELGAHQRRSRDTLDEGMGCRVAVARWSQEDGVALAIEREIEALGCHAFGFTVNELLPHEVDVVLTFAPYGRFGPLTRQLGRMPGSARPKWIHWSMECFPNLRIPWPFVSRVSIARSWIDARRVAEEGRSGPARRRLMASGFGDRLTRWRIVGDYLRALQTGLMTQLVESSSIHAEIYRAHGFDVPYVPWGMSSAWYADLDLERDIDVLWMGKRRTRRRSRILDHVREDLSRRGVEMHVIDGVERPFVHGEERIQVLNRAKVTLNILPRWYDTAFPFRFVHAAANGSQVVSEPVLSHCPEIEADVHYRVAHPDALVERIITSLRDPEPDRAIVSASRALVRDRLSLRESIGQLLEVIG